MGKIAVIKGEKVNLLVMRDNGETRSVRMRLSTLIALMLVAAIMPFVAIAGIWFSIDLWRSSSTLVQENHRLTREGKEAKAKAERLGNLEKLLQRNATTETLVTANVHKPADPKASPVEEEVAAPMQDGPGHSEFPAINTGYITVDNINARQQPGGKLRISLDLRNPDTRKTLSGEVFATLVTAAGESMPLQFRPQDAGDFRITRLKRAVLVAILPPQTNLTNAQVVIEVKNDSGELVYRNVFPVER